MSHEILSAKLYELDREFGLLHGSIQLSETASREQLGQELAGLRQKRSGPSGVPDKVEVQPLSHGRETGVLL